jgi:hypothetical protein
MQFLLTDDDDHDDNDDVDINQTAKISLLKLLTYIRKIT